MKEFNLLHKLLILTLLHPFTCLVSQDGNYFSNSEGIYTSGYMLNRADSLALMQLPTIPEAWGTYKSDDLPTVVDNSDQPYFRPLFEQVASECGQYAAIGFNFTYEINYTRNTNASLPENQFPTHYTYNFMNGGFGWHGVSYFHSFEIARSNGHPNVIDFGSNNECGPSYWLSGYDAYYNGMSNKLDEVYQIRVDNEDGLLLLKNWLHNHLAGDEVGGIACFYSATPWNLNTLPANSPEGGRFVITDFKYPAGHSSTITGYHDSIRYDYNQDGQFTNNIDINNDGVVDMKDWEIGGLKFTDSYIGGVNWADSGFCYMMYKTLADKLGEGGIWNNVVHIVKVKEAYTPMLTMKIELEHNCREKIKVVAGVSSPSQSYPEHTLAFPIFDFQGACQFMQGGWDPAAKSIEFGLDITPLLGAVDPGVPATFFFQLIEDDPLNQGSGKIHHFSIIDHVNNNHAYEFPGTNMPIVENGVTSLAVDAQIDFTHLGIVNEALPYALTGEPYSQQMLAEGGTPPYSWKLVEHYNESLQNEAFPEVNETAIAFPDTVHSSMPLLLPFPFSFYGEPHDTVWVHTDGFLMFDDQDYPWPYLYDEHLMIRKTRNLSPALNSQLYIDADQNDGVWVESTNERVIIRWKMSSKLTAEGTYEFAASLYPTGIVKFHYNQLSTNTTLWASGVSKGDGVSHQYADEHAILQEYPDKAFVYEPQDHPYEISLSEDGLLTGTPMQNYEGVELVFDLTDSNLLNRRKSLLFHSYFAGVGENSEQMFNNIRVSPNPSTGNFRLDFELKEKRFVVVELMDPSGKTVRMLHTGVLEKGNQQLQIVQNQSDIPVPGVYYVVFKSGDTILSAEKIIITQ